MQLHLVAALSAIGARKCPNALQALVSFQARRPDGERFNPARLEKSRKSVRDIAHKGKKYEMECHFSESLGLRVVDFWDCKDRQGAHNVLWYPSKSFHEQRRVEG